MHNVFGFSFVVSLYVRLCFFFRAINSQTLQKKIEPKRMPINDWLSQSNVFITDNGYANKIYFSFLSLSMF